uniref:Uncharacterized protein n=1 Tax=Sinocyclocheilus rhinocerous TaxID=307959 RepID=A0A673M0D7_9TELE
MIQSSQPSSLKFTCKGFLLHLDLDFLPCLLPWRLGPFSFPRLSKPHRLSSVALSSKQKRVPWEWLWRSLKTSHTSKTSHFGLCASSRSKVLESRTVCDWQESSCISTGPISDARKLPEIFVYILSSAPKSSTFSERVDTSNKYFCLHSGEFKRSSGTKSTNPRKRSCRWRSCNHEVQLHP